MDGNLSSLMDFISESSLQVIFPATSIEGLSRFDLRRRCKKEVKDHGNV